MSRRERLDLIVRLSIPSILAQLSVIVMLYIDASMVGSLGADASASIGLVSTTTWLFSGLCSAAAIGFSVQAAHRIGAGDNAGARAVLRQGLTATFAFGLLAAAVGCAISGPLPVWLGGNADIVGDATRYFRIYALSLPLLQLNYLSGGMLRCSGNMRLPSMLSLLMCVLDVMFNALLIFPSRTCFLGRCCVHVARRRYGCCRGGCGYGCRRSGHGAPDDGLSLPPVARTGLEARARQFSADGAMLA